VICRPIGAGNSKRWGSIRNSAKAYASCSIWHFGTGEWSAEQADRHLRDIDHMFERLREEPKLGHKRDELIAGVRSIPVQPHLIFYFQTPQAISIVRVLHQRFDTTMHFRA
jgi:toxin ParE1/3/4